MTIGRRKLIQTGLAATPAILMTSCSQPSETTAAPPPLSRQSIYEALFDYMRTLDIIDAHEHLNTETQRLKMDVDVMMLIAQYTYVDMCSAGYKPRKGESMFMNNLCLDTSVPLEKRWQAFWPYLQNIKYGSYYQAPKIALRDLYGIDDLNEKTYRQASEKLKADNKPGLFKAVLRDRCRIKTCLVQNGRIEGQDPADLLTPVYTGTSEYTLFTHNHMKDLQRRYDTPIKNLDTFLQLVGRAMEDAKAQGAVACKIYAEAQGPLDQTAAQQEFEAVLAGAAFGRALRNVAIDSVLQKAGQMSWPMAVHTGVWGDFRTQDPKPVIDLVMRHPEVQFDIYHLGMPYVRDCIFIAKNFPNAHLNLCWTYVLSQSITEKAINEIIDTVPTNKIFAFGGDYIWSVENVYGHLQMARQSLAYVLSGRIIKGKLDIDGAKYILKRWFYDNPAGFYGLA